MAAADPTGPRRSAVMSTDDDGHYVVFAGRRWRATDPAIPEPRRDELTHILMAWRREVRRTLGTPQEAAARAGRAGHQSGSGRVGFATVVGTVRR